MVVENHQEEDLNPPTNQTTASNNNIDEINKYINGRYVGPSEATIWHIYGFAMHGRYPPIFRLHIHLPNQQPVYFRQGQHHEAFMRGPPDTMLIAYFNCVQREMILPLPNNERGEDMLNVGSFYPPATELTYNPMPTYYTYDSTDKIWNRRKKHPMKSDTIARIYSVSPRSEELFYLRMLLHKIKGCTSFEYLKQIDEETRCLTFKESCLRRGFLLDDNEWKLCLQEAINHCSPKQLRDLFVNIICYNNPVDVLSLWNLLDNAGIILFNKYKYSFKKK